jgi:hypothetical protein
MGRSLIPGLPGISGHGNASQRPAAAISSSLRPVLPGTGASELAIQAGFPTLRRHPSSH